MRAGITRFLVITAAVTVATIFTVQPASAEQPNWWQGTPTIKKVKDIPESSTQNKYCIKTKIVVERVVRQIVMLVDEEHCMVPTSYGQINSDGTVLQPVGQSAAYPIVKPASTRLMPIPHMPGMLRNNTASFNHGSSMGLYKNFYDDLELKYIGGKHYVLHGEPDEYFRTGNGNLRRLNTTNTLNFTHNGHELVVEDKLAGFIKINLGSLEVTQYYQPIVETSSGSLLAAGTAIHEEGAAFIGYNAPSGWGSKFAEVIDTKDCVTVPASNGVRLNFNPCKHRDLLPEIASAIPGLERIYNPKFINNRTIKFEAQVNLAGTIRFAEYTITAPGEKYRQLEYLAMGDSFASGQGAGNYRDGTDTIRNRCHQSTLSYPHLFTRYFESSASVACSGAQLRNIFLKNTNDRDVASQLANNQIPEESEKDAARIKYLPGYVEQLSFIDKTPSVVTISIGGNDIKFTDKLVKCVHPKSTSNNHTCFATYEERVEVIKEINGRLQRFRDTFKELLRDDPGRKVYVMGYPQIANPAGDCANNVEMSRQELEGAEDLIHYLNRVINQAADEAGAYYVDVEDALGGYRLCETKSSSVAVNGITVRFDQGKTIEFTESFHPNAKGQELLAAAIRSKTKNFTEPMPAPTPELASLPIDNNIDFLRNIPKVNRTVYNVKHEDSPLYPRYKSDPQELVLEGKMQLLKPNYDFEAVLHSDPTELGTFTTDSDGNLRVDYQIPDSIEPGIHTLHLYGKDIFDNDINIQQTLYVAANEQDIDGDGIPNDQDVCVGEQAAEDADKDGIPDSCDSFIDDLSGLLRIDMKTALDNNGAMPLSLLASVTTTSDTKSDPINIVLSALAPATIKPKNARHKLVVVVHATHQSISKTYFSMQVLLVRIVGCILGAFLIGKLYKALPL
jgi:lysophospholipase L1-like esterase